MDKYYRIQSNNNPCGIVVEGELYKEDILEHYFEGHSNVITTEISKAEYNHTIYGA